MEIRLIAADMDGTLLDDEKGIPEETCALSAHARHRGSRSSPGDRPHDARTAG